MRGVGSCPCLQAGIACVSCIPCEKGKCCNLGPRLSQDNGGQLTLDSFTSGGHRKRGAPAPAGGSQRSDSSGSDSESNDTDDSPSGSDPEYLGTVARQLNLGLPSGLPPLSETGPSRAPPPAAPAPTGVVELDSQEPATQPTQESAPEEVEPPQQPLAADGAAAPQQPPAQAEAAEEPLEVQPPPIVTERDADKDRIPAEADRLMDTVYGDHVHQNDGTHLAGGVNAAVDEAWQRRWRSLTGQQQQLYTVPGGEEGKDFVRQFRLELEGVRSRRWNAERPLAFIMVMLVRVNGVTKFRDVRSRLKKRLAAWNRGEHEALVQDTLRQCALRDRGLTRRELDEAQVARLFDGKVRSGRLREAVRGLTDRSGGGVLDPEAHDAKSNKPVFEALKDKHPPARETPPEVMTEPRRLPAVLEMHVSSDTIERAARRLQGAAGPCGLDAVELKHLLFRFGGESIKLTAEVAAWTEWLANASPPWAAYRALMANRLIAIDKQPGVRPVGCGEVLRRLMAKAVILVAGDEATEACGNDNLCAGLSAGIEGAFHALREAFEPPQTAAAPRNPTVPAEPPAPAADPPAPLLTQELEEPCDATLLVDAKNGFNELNRTAMLWQVRFRWPSGSRFAFNCYRHHGQLVMRRPSGESIILFSQEGVTQGDPLSMILYGLGLLPLTRLLKKEFPELIQPWYADDAAAQGDARQLRLWLDRLKVEGPKYGYLPEPDKSIVLVHPGSADLAVREALASFPLKWKEGSRYLGGYLGSSESREQWLQPQLDAWAGGVRRLAMVAERYPHTAYSGLAHSLQGEWQYLQRMVAGVGEKFAPIEEAISDTFFPALAGGADGELTEQHQRLRRIGAKEGGLGIRSPLETAERCHRTSSRCTSVLVGSLLGRCEWSLEEHMEKAALGRKAGVRTRIQAELATFASVVAAAPEAERRRLRRGQHTGRWLNLIPNSRNDTCLSAEEFRDSLRLRLGLDPLALPSRCDGCGAPFTVSHALQCKKGNLVTLRHDDVKAVWEEMLGEGLRPSAVRDEPYLIGRNRDEAPPPADPDAPVPPRPPDLRGDISAHGFWRRGRDCIFDVSISDTDGKSYGKREPEKVLASREKTKRKKYRQVCEDQRRDFTPLVYSVDGLVGEEARRAAKRLGRLLSNKWKRVHSDCCGYVTARLSIALVRSASLCLRNSRVYKTYPRSVEYGAGKLAQLL